VALREWLLLWTGPGLFAGITTGDWMDLLRENRFAVDPPYWWRAAVITLGSLGNSLARSREEAVLARLLPFRTATRRAPGPKTRCLGVPGGVLIRPRPDHGVRKPNPTTANALPS